MTTECTHYERRYVRITEFNDFSGETEETYEWQEISLLRDIDLHRYTCTRCNEIFFYSSFGRSLFK